MKKTVIVSAIVFAASFVVGRELVPVPRAKCAWCYSGKCYSSGMCGSGCICLKRGYDVAGYCYGVE